MPGPVPPSGEEEKIILNGGIAADVLNRVCARLYDRFEKGQHLPNQAEIIVKLNLIEDEAFKVVRLYLDGTGFEGPYSHAVDLP